MQEDRSERENGLELDMSKANDYIKSDFIMVVVKKMRFGDKWIGLIFRCLS